MPSRAIFFQKQRKIFPQSGNALRKLPLFFRQTMPNRVFYRQIIVGQNAIDAHVQILLRLFGLVRVENVAQCAVFVRLKIPPHHFALMVDGVRRIHP